jgi:hypothetical protein
VETRISI